MKKINYVVVLCMLFMLFSLQNIQAQVSKGGIPPSIQFKSMVTSGLDEINVPAINVSAVMADDSARPGPLWVGRSVPVGVNMTNAGTWTEMPDGSRVWRLKIKASGAKAIGVYYDDFYIPEGGKLFLYNEAQTQVIGAYTSENNPPAHLFATELIQGESVTLEYVEGVKRATKFETLDYLNGLFRESKHYGSGSLVASQTPIISISEISYVYKDIPFLFKYDPAKSTGWNASNACQVNVNCTPEGTNWQDQKNGVAEIYLKIGASYGFCSGTLVNTTNNSGLPYFLTADHCHSEGGTTASAADMAQWEFYFKYEAAGCPDPGTEPSYSTIIGCTLKAASPINGGSDFCLVLFNSTPPQSYLPYYNGWDRTSTAATSGVGIHHPQGDIKKISTFSSTVTTATWDDGTNVGMANAHWEGEYVETTNGFSQTEGGSSGSPLFNSAGRQVGTLTGGTAANCTNGSLFDYGKFFYHWDKTGTGPTTQLKTWLDPTTTNLTTANGYDPFATAVPATDFVAVSPSTLLYPIPILRTQTVTYEDRSWGAPSTWSWVFQGGTPATSTAQNPSAVTYNTIGLFDVSLTAHNANGDSTLTAGDYIHVMDPTTVTCDTMYQFWGTPTVYTATAGYVGGSNGYGCQAIAEKFVNYTPFNKVTGGRFWWAQATNGSSPNVTFVVWADDGSGNPGAQLATTTVPLSTIVSNFNGVGYTDVVFPSDVILPTNSFFLGFMIPGSMGSGDTLAIITNNDDDNDNQTGYSLYTSWETYAAWGMSLSNTIFPFACHDPFLPPVCDFSGTPTMLPATQSVTFTNHCYGGAVTTYNWSFPGAATTSSSQANPVIQYNNPGYYSVTLTVSNAYGSDVMTKTSYIHVMSASSCSCNTLDNVVGNEMVYNMGADGYVSGTNSYFTQVAEIFDDYGTYTNLNGAYFSWGYVYLVSGTTNVTFTAYRNNGTGGAPNTVMGTTTVPMSTIYNDYINNQMTYVQFATPLAITTPFYIAMTMPTTGDTIAVNTGAENAGTNDGWAKYNGTWYSYYDLFGSSFNNAIYPIVCSTGAPLPDFVSNIDTVYQTGSVIFTDHSTCSPASWSWTFEGGTPATSTTQNPTVVYNTVGTYDVTLVATNASGNNTELKADHITVVPIIVKWDFPVALGDNANSDGGILANYNPPTYKTITVQGGVSTPTFTTAGATTKCASATGWASGSGTKYWQIEFVTTGYRALKVSSKMTGDNNASPRDFKLQYKIGAGGTWTDVEGATAIKLALSSWTTSSANLSYVPLPSACNNQASVYLRWIMTSNTPISGTGNVGSTRACLIDDIIVCGAPMDLNPPVAAFSGTPTTICQGSSVTYTDLSTNSPTSWAWTFAGGTPATSTAQNPTVAYNTAGTYNVTLIATNANGSDTITSTNYVTVSAPIAQAITGTTPICIGSNQTWTSTTGGGTWTSGTPAVATVGSGTGVVTGVTAGTSVITYSVTTGGCVNTATKTVTISAPVAQTITGTTPICIGSNQTWTSTTGGGTWTSGTPAVATVGSGTGVVTGVTAGSSLITYSVTTGGCVNTATKTVTISAPTAQTITGTTPICIGSNQTWTSTTGGGTWTSGTPAVATVGSGTGIVTGVTAGSSVITYTVTTGVCVNTATKTVTVNNNTIVPTFTALGPYCVDATPGILPATSNNGITGTWSPDMINTASTGTTTYTFTPTTGQCAVQTTMNIEVDENITPLFTQLGPYCVGATPGTLPTTSNNGISGTWDPATISTASAGTTTYTFTPTIGQCATNTVDMIVTVNANVLPTFAVLGPYCVGAIPDALPTTSTNGITGTWSPAVISTSAAGTTLYTFTPTAGQCATTATMNVTVNQMPFADAGVDATYTVTPIQIGNAANGPGTISWSPSTGLSNPNIAQPLASPAVTTTYTLTVVNNGCIATDAVTITIGDLGHTISGKTLYSARANVGIPAPNPATYNAVAYSIDNVIVILKNYPSGTEVARDTSDALGHYQFNAVMNGNYILSYVKYAADTMQWCNDVNAGDVGLLMYLITSDTVLDPSRCFSAKYQKAADVDNNNLVNTIDVARIKAKIGSPYLASKNFPKGNWDVLNSVVTMAGADLNINLQTICNGDYNASSSKYRDSLTTWSGAKSHETNIIVASNEYISITDPGYFEIPLRISSKMNEFSALGLELTYPEGYKLTNAYIPKALTKTGAVKINPTLDEIITDNNDLLVTDEGGVIRVVYATTKHFDVAANDEMIVLGFRKLNDKQQLEPEFKLSGTGIIANQYGEEDDGAYLLMPKLLVQGGYSGEGFEFTGYPNPFNGEATITYNLPENGTVKIKAYNATGELVSEIINEEQIAGKHMVDFSPKYLPAGMYTFKLEFVGLNRSECLILKMIH